MFKSRRSLGLLALSGLVLFGSSVAGAWAQTGTTQGPFYQQATYEKRIRKLARGFANILLSPAEIPSQAFQEAYRTTPITGGLVGAGKGFIKGGKRILIGFWEIATFYAPMNTNYGPYIEPELPMMEFNR